MRAYFFLCITFFSLSSAMAQLNPFLPAKAVLKTGDTLNNIVGKYKANKTFVYKSDTDKKAIKIDFSNLESVQITNSKGIIDTSYFFKRKDQNTYVKVALLMKGKKLEVYGIHGVNSGSGVGIGMGFSIGIPIPYTTYYIRKTGENDITYMGTYGTIRGLFKVKVYEYFSDCELLIQKLKEKELRLRDGLVQIAEYYENHCVND